MGEEGYDQQQQKDNERGRNEVKKDFVILRAISFALFSGYGSVLVLQSSINIEGGTGVWSLMATYIGGTLFNVVLTPTVIRNLGTRKTMILAECTYLLYCLINFYPEPYLLIPAGLFLGIGEACSWPVIMILISDYGHRYSKYASKSGAYYTTQMVGYFFTSLAFSQVFGNLLTWGILYAGVESIASNSTVDLTVCRANDCQDPNITAVNIQQYQRATEAARYDTIGAMSAF